MLAATALGACGQGSSTVTNPTSSSSASTTPAGNGTLRTKAQAVAFAEAVNLRPADVPGFRPAPSEQPRGTGEQRLERAMLECVGLLSGHDELAQVDSREFEQATVTGQLGVSSSVAVARTPAIAARGLTPTHNPQDSPRARACLAHSLSRDVERNPKGGPNILSLSASPERALAPGTGGGVVLRTVADVTLGSRPVPLSLDFYGFVCGQTQIGLFTTSLPGSFPSKSRQQLLSLLLARAKAHGQCAAHSTGAAGAHSTGAAGAHSTGAAGAPAGGGGGAPARGGGGAPARGYSTSPSLRA
jgi:hypothetical protein